MYRLAHLSDPHVGPLPATALRDLMNKRLLGYLSYTRRRRHLHRMEVLEALAADLRSEAADHCAVTGDLTNIALPGEFETAARWLATLDQPRNVSVIPGNHDAYVSQAWERSRQHWQAYMAGEEASDPEAFPYLRRRGPLALIGLSSACPTGYGFASGALGETQLERLEALLAQIRGEGLCRVVLVHHPPRPEATGRRKRLTDGGRLCAAIARQGAELVLHGHDHTLSREQLAGPEGPAQVFGVPSASAVRGHGRRPAAHYHIYGIERQATGWRVEVLAKGYDPATAGFREARRDSITLVRKSAP